MEINHPQEEKNEKKVEEGARIKDTSKLAS